MRELLEKERKSEDDLKLKKILEVQNEKLRLVGCSRPILEIFQNQQDEVISVASRISFAKGNLPIIQVIPRTYLTVFTQMPMVRNGRVKGYNTLDPTAIFEVIETPSRPYYLFNVENGQATLGQSPKDAEYLIKRQGRLPLTEVEVIALAIQIDVLSHHYLDATGCRYGDESKTPYLGLNHGRPALFWFRYRSGHPKWGSPSCAKRLSLF